MAEEQILKEQEKYIEVTLRQGKKNLGTFVFENQADWNEISDVYKNYNKLVTDLANSEKAEMEDRKKKLQDNLKELDEQLKNM
jgi:hypothetical protein